jgi:hypothetical protein
MGILPIILICLKRCLNTIQDPRTLFPLLTKLIIRISNVNNSVSISTSPTTSTFNPSCYPPQTTNFLPPNFQINLFFQRLTHTPKLKYQRSKIKHDIQLLLIRISCFHKLACPDFKVREDNRQVLPSSTYSSDAFFSLIPNNRRTK